MLTKEKNKLDKMWNKTVRDDFKNKCVICGKDKYINIHHFVGRRSLSTRWYIPNGIPLCPSHHTFDYKSAHQSPEHFRETILELWGEKWLTDLMKQSNKVCKSDFETVKKYLEGKLKNYC